jgi:hypothetical protein
MTLLASKSAKAFIVHADLSITGSPYICNILHDNHTASTTISYPDFDQFAFGLFARRLYDALVAGPNDFHTMQHYICLDVLVERLHIEKLKNSVLDLVVPLSQRQHDDTSGQSRVFVKPNSGSKANVQGPCQHSGVQIDV